MSKVLTSFSWCPVGAVLRSIPGDDFIVPAISLYWKRDLQNVIAALHSLQDTLHLLPFLLQTHPPFHVLNQFVFCDGTGSVEKVLHHVKEFRVGSGRDVLEVVRDVVVSSGVLLSNRNHGTEHLPQLLPGGGALAERLKPQHGTGFLSLSCCR